MADTNTTSTSTNNAIKTVEQQAKDAVSQVNAKVEKVIEQVKVAKEEKRLKEANTTNGR